MLAELPALLPAVLPSVQPARRLRSSSVSTLHRNMHASSADAASFGVMVGSGETFLPAFALAIGLGEVAAGLVASVPLMAGGLLQLVSIHFLTRGFPEKWWVIGAAGVQALAFIPLLFIAWTGEISTGLMLAIASVYWAGGLATGPAWNNWIEKMIPRAIRPGYFASRTRTSQVATLASFVAAGVLLEYARRGEWLQQAFAVIFGAALLARLFSVAMLARHRLPEGKRTAPVEAPTFSIPTIRTAPGESLNGRQLLFFLVAVQAMVQLSGPFFTPFMLQKLEFSYTAFTALTAVAFLAKILSLAAWGTMARRRGAVWLLTIGATGIVPLSALWIVSQNFYWLVFVQALNGATWAAYELGFFLLFFEALPPRRRVRMLSLYNAANTIAWCGGSMIGALLLRQLGTDFSAYYVLFALSSIGRLGALLYLYFHRPSVKIRVTTIGLRVLGLRPNGTSVETPILPSIPRLPGESSNAA